MYDMISILEDDLANIEEALEVFDSYSFSRDLQSRMASLGLSSSALARRCHVTHTIVDKWKSGKARPNGKERYKELGMALGMNTDTLNSFLLQNGYPVLYVKNPLDSAARLLLLQSAGAPDLVEMYRALVHRLHLDKLSTYSDRTIYETTVMSKELKKAAQNGHASTWFENFRHQFAGSAKTELPDLRLARFLLLYLGEKNIHELAVTGDLPPVLQNLLYPVLAGKAVTVKRLREKLIAFGLYANMKEEEIDIMLRWARLMPLSEPVSSLDLAVLAALRAAHDRYIFYELENLQRIIRRLSPPQDDFETLMLAQYCQRTEAVEPMASYYEQHSKSPLDKAFEERYTSFADRGVMDYVHDLLVLLIDGGDLKEDETEEFLKMISRNEDGDSIWG